jgi:hypothetical protein
MKTHAKQVAAWGKLLGLCHELNGSFNPSKETVTCTALVNLLNESQQSIESVHITESALTHAVNLRGNYMKQLPVIGSRIIGALQAIDAPVDILNDVDRIRKRLSYQQTAKTGDSAQKKKSVQSESTASGESSGAGHTKRQQLDVESKIDNFDLLIQTLRDFSGYTTEEPGITIGDLTAFQQELRQVNKNAIDAFKASKKARTVRDNLLYSATGMHGRSKMVKGYFRSKFGSGSAEFKAVQHIQFKKRGR